MKSPKTAQHRAFPEIRVTFAKLKNGNIKVTFLDSFDAPTSMTEKRFNELFIIL